MFWAQAARNQSETSLSVFSCAQAAVASDGLWRKAEEEAAVAWMRERKYPVFV